MEYVYTTLFHRSYAILKQPQQAKIDRAIRRLQGHPFHPFAKGLRVHKLEGVRGTPTKPGGARPDVWEMHAHGDLLVTFQYGDDEILFRNCGNHKSVLKSP